MTHGVLERLRRKYHQEIFESVLRTSSHPNNADGSSRGSVALGNGIIREIGLQPQHGRLPGQTAGRAFESATRTFIENAFDILRHLRPGCWRFSIGGDISRFAQYRHLSQIREFLIAHRDLRTTLGDYIVKPDIVVSRSPVTDDEINEHEFLIASQGCAARTPLRDRNSAEPLLHASISCKWTIRSDRSQNARTEGLNLLRNRKGKAPSIAVVTAEPLPSRIASLALGTGDIDCVYHFALPELQAAARGRESDAEFLQTLVEGDRLRDISDLPFDLIT